MKFLIYYASYFIFATYLLCSSNLIAQKLVNPSEPFGNQKNKPFYYGFETNEALAKWQTSQTTHWITTTEQKFKGNKSLKFTLNETNNSIESFVTPYTISKVRNAVRNGQSIIVASSYDGRILGIDFNGNILWDIGLKPSTSDEPSDVGNNDIFCFDLNNDGNDEILVASADGNLYCLDSENGVKLWDTFAITQISGVTPMYAVCVVKKNGTPYIACGNFDNSIYYLNADGSFNKEVKSEKYSRFKFFGDKGFNLFKDNLHIANFLRPIPQDENNDHLGMLATNNSMQVNGVFYQFEPLEDLPIQIPGAATNEGITLKTNKPIGYFKLVNNPSNNEPIILLGNSTQRNTSGAFTLNPDIDNYTSKINIGTETIQNTLVDIKGNGYADVNGYRIPQSEIVDTPTGKIVVTLFGSDIIIQDENLTSSKRIQSSFSYNDLWKDSVSGKLLFAGSQSGGSCVHVVDTMNPDWEQNYIDLVPPGKIKTLLNNVETIKTQVASFVKPSYEVPAIPNNVYFVTGLNKGTSNATKAFITTMETIDPTNGPRVLENIFNQRYRNWDRASDFSSVEFQNKRDSRFTYLDCDENPDISVCDDNYKNVTQIRINALNRNPHGVSFWGGHGNDPAPFSQPVLNEIMTADVIKQKVLIYPEIVDKSTEFESFMDEYLYEIADNIKTNNLNTKMHMRTKHTFWQGDVYKDAWDRLISGEFADVFVPTMEETQDKSMDLSVSGRMGVWMSGAVNDWGSRSVPDNASYDRLRQFSHPRTGNHFLRHTIYSMASGATHFNNLDTFESDWMQLVLELTARGAIYVPRREQLLSISPIRLSILNPDLQYIYKSTSVKFLTAFDKTVGEEKFVFGRLHGAFPGAKNTPYDFSTYAAGVKERRLNFIPPYENGMVLITPPDIPDGQPQPERGKLEDHMHPFYTGKTKEYFTDGKKYYSDYNQTAAFDPDSNYYENIKNDIINSAELLPLKVSGNVAWVVCQTDKRHLRLTLIDTGYLNPHGGTAKVEINSSEINVSSIINILKPSETYSGSNIEIEIPIGGFKFFDITLSNDYY